MAWYNKILKKIGKEPPSQFFNDEIDDFEIQKGRNGAGFVELSGPTVENDRVKVDIGGATINADLGAQESKTLDHTFQNAAVSAANGTALTVAAYKTLTIEISGTSTSRTIVFEGQGPSGTYYPIQGVKSSDLSMDTQTTGNGEIWSFEITGLTSFRARISGVSGGNVTVKGKAVA